MVRASICASVLTVVFAFGAIGACSLFVDTDGLSSSADNDAATVEASSDAPIESDAKAPRDAATVDAADAAPTPFCASHPGHVLCYDFDDSIALPAADGTFFDPGHLVIDTGQSVSPPSSLLMQFNQGDSNEQFQKNISQTKGGTLSWSLDIKFDSSDMTSGQTTPLATDVPAVPELSDHYFYLQTYYGSFNISESSTPADGGATDYRSWDLHSPVPVGTWQHVEWTIDGSTGNMTFSLNGSALPTAQSEYGFPSGGAQVTVGGYAGNLPASTTVHVDNILIDY